MLSVLFLICFLFLLDEIKKLKCLTKLWGTRYSMNMLGKVTSDNSILCYFRLIYKDL